jgi:hypothetical protein
VDRHKGDASPLHGLTLLDISIVLSRCRTYISAALLSHLYETNERLSEPIMRYNCTLRDKASACSLVTRRSFVTTAHRELSVALVQSQGYMHRNEQLLDDVVLMVLLGTDTPFLD